MRFSCFGGKMYFYGFNGKVCFTFLAEKCGFTSLAENTFLRKNAFLRFWRVSLFFSFGGKMHFSVLAEKCICKKIEFWFENNILILKSYFCHLSFWTELDAFASKCTIKTHLHLD